MDDVKREVIECLREFLNPTQIAELGATPQFAQAVADIIEEFRMEHDLK
jgi:hypothetical protein